MKNLFKKTTMFLMAAIMVMSMCVPAFATGNELLDQDPVTPDSNGNYTQPFDTTNATLSLPVYVAMDEYAYLPEITFNGTINNNISDSQLTDGRLKGIEPDNVQVSIPTIEEGTLGQTKNTASDILGLNEHMTESQKFVSTIVAIDFSNVSFTEPGVYRYQLNIIPPSAREVMVMTGATQYFVDVYVQNNDDLNGLEVADILVYDNNSQGKMDDIIFDYKTVDGVVAKMLEGNQANMNDKFQFTVEITTLSDAYKNAIFTITIDDQEYKTTPNGDGTHTATFELGHNDKAIIHGLPYFCGKVTITEDNGDYQARCISGPHVTGSGGVHFGSDIGNSCTFDFIDGDTIYNYDPNALKFSDYEAFIDSLNIHQGEFCAAFINTKEGVIPTGVFLAVGPMVGIAAIGGVGMMASKKHRKDEDEE